MKNRNYLLIYSWLITLQGFAQSGDFNLCDSILSKSSFTQQDFQQLDTILFSMNYYRSDAAARLYKRAITKSEEGGLPDFAAHFEIWLADLYYELSDLDSGAYYASRAAQRALEMGDSLTYARTANIRRLNSLIQRSLCQQPVHISCTDFDVSVKVIKVIFELLIVGI